LFVPISKLKVFPVFYYSILRSSSQETPTDQQKSSETKKFKDKKVATTNSKMSSHLTSFLEDRLISKKIVLNSSNNYEDF
jgi:uncharacterized protein YpmS